MCYMSVAMPRCYCRVDTLLTLLSLVLFIFCARCATLYFVNGVKKLSMYVPWLQFTNGAITLASMFTLDSHRTINVDTTICKIIGFSFGFIFISMSYGLGSGGGCCFSFLLFLFQHFLLQTKQRSAQVLFPFNCCVFALLFLYTHIRMCAIESMCVLSVWLK